MANLNTIIKTASGIQEHYLESKQYFAENNIVGIFLQGSQNYGLETEDSDIDTKLITTPTLNEVIYNRQPMSTTHFRANKEHIDFKDIRLMFDTFRKQNLNFIEILFTNYKIINSMYKKEWEKLVAANEIIAHYNPYSAVKAMSGIALGKKYALTKETEAHKDVFEKFSYDPKQLYQLVRIDEYLDKYIAGAPYKDCLCPDNPQYLKDIKTGLYTKEEAIKVADEHIAHINTICIPYTKDSEFNCINEEAESLLQEVQADIVKKSLAFELEVSK